MLQDLQQVITIMDVIESGELDRSKDNIHFATLHFTFDGQVVNGNEMEGSFESESQGSGTFQLSLENFA